MILSYPTRAAIGQGVMLAALVAVGLGMFLLQAEPLRWPELPVSRMIWAVACVVAYVGVCVRPYLRRMRSHAVSSSERISDDETVIDGDSIRVMFASQTGFAEELAHRTAAALRDAGMSVHADRIDRLTPSAWSGATRMLFVVSTTGEGDAPDSALAFVRDIMSRPVALSHLKYGLLSLGDHAYTNFCGFGRTVDTWLRRHGAQPLFDPVEVDDGDPAALRHWQHHLSLLAGRTDMPDWAPPRYSHWPLAERTLLNPGSRGHACYLVALAVPSDVPASWEAGDIVEIGPRNAMDQIAEFMARLKLDGETRIAHDQIGMMTLSALLSRCVLPELDASNEKALPDLLRTLTPLPHREYSIASLPEDGRIELLVRRMHRPDGRIGLGSGWLTRHAGVGTDIDARIRSNPGFHAPSPDVPTILIGNGTGLAGLRALLKARIAAGSRRNWLLFGERNADCDFFFRDEILRWHRDGWIERLDLAFSRDQSQRIYVQDRLREGMDELQQWLAEGASIYVCGSLSGMAPGVHAVLARAIGENSLIDLSATGRYRRDVY